MVDARAAAQRAAEVAGPDLDVGGEVEDPLVERAIEGRRAFVGIDREVGTGDVADEQRVPAEQRGRVATARGVAQDEGGVLRPVARRVDRLDLDLAERQPPAVGDRLVRIVDVGELVDVDRGPSRPRQPPVAGDVVGVVVGLEHVLDADPVQAGEAQVRLDVPLRIDDRGDPCVDVADQVGGATEVLVDHLPEQHRSLAFHIGSRAFLTRMVKNA